MQTSKSENSVTSQSLGFLLKVKFQGTAWEEENDTKDEMDAHLYKLETSYEMWVSPTQTSSQKQIVAPSP